MGRIRTAAARKLHKDEEDKVSDDDGVVVKKSKPGPKSSKRTSKRQSTSSIESPRKSRRFRDVKDDESPTNGVTIDVESENNSSEDEAPLKKQSPTKSTNKSPSKVTKRKADSSTSEQSKKKPFPPSKKSKREENRYEVEEIIDHKIENKVKYFLIRWKGYGSDVDSWETSYRVNCPALLAQYYEKHPEARLSAKMQGDKRKKKKKIVLPPPRQLKIDEQIDYNSDWDENEDYEVDRIIDVRYHRGNTRDFLIRWKGYSSNSDSWEPESNLNCKDLIEKFMEKLDKVKNVTHKELREVRPKTQRFTLMTQADARRLSKRNVGRQRANYYDCDA